jgi:hypothetical protein
MVGEGVDRDDLLPQRGCPPGEVERRADGARDAVRTHLGDLGGIGQVAVHPQPGTPVRLAARAQQQYLRRGVGGAAGRAQQLGGRVAGEHPTPLDQDGCACRSQGEVCFEVGGCVDVREEALEPRAAEPARRHESGGDGGGAAERAGEVDRHAPAQTAAARFRFHDPRFRFSTVVVATKGTRYSRS